MAVGPSQLTDEFFKEIDLFEEKIDSMLIGMRLAPGESVQINVPRGMGHPHWGILKGRYLRVGWHSIEWHSDQRDGDFLSFKQEE